MYSDAERILVVANKTDLCSNTPTTSNDTATEDNEERDEASPERPANGLKARAVSTNDGRVFATANGLLYVETSAKEGWGVVEAFERTAKEVLKRHNEEELKRRKVGASVPVVVQSAA